MNNLSWLLYLADICGKVSALFGILAFISGALTLVCMIAAMSEGDSDDIKSVAKAALIPVLFALIACLVPSRNTVYAIAASEMGERVIQTPTFNKATEALNAWLERQIQPDNDDKS